MSEQKRPNQQPEKRDQKPTTGRTEYGEKIIREGYQPVTGIDTSNPPGSGSNQNNNKGN